MRKCTKCKQQKELTDFRKDNRTQDGYYTYCLICQRAAQKIYTSKKKEGTIKAF